MDIVGIIATIMGLSTAVAAMAFVIELAVITIQEITRAIRRWWGRVRNITLLNPAQNRQLQEAVMRAARVSQPIKRIIVNEDSGEYALVAGNSIESQLDSYSPIPINVG